MEKVSQIVQHIQEQLQNNAKVEHLLITAQMLVAEIKQQQTITTNKVSVVMPIFYNSAEPIAIANPIETTENFTQEDAIIELQEPDIEEPIVQEQEPTKHQQFLYENFANIPTFAHQETKEIFVLNDVLIDELETNINTKFKEQIIEVAEALETTPIKDLKKAIGINDRHIFVNELFRGDDNMYERSLKTIQSFSILPEALFWMDRELKTKLGWGDDSLFAKNFYQLVKRRFS